MSASSSPRMLSLWLPRFATDRIRRLREVSPSPRIGEQTLAVRRAMRGEGRGEGEDRQAQNRGNAPSPACRRSATTGDLSPYTGRGELPLVVAGKRGNADVLIAVDDIAERLGLTPGLALAQARAMHPALDVVPEDADADAELLENIAEWCLRYTPLIACDAPDGLLLDISGCAHLYGGERQLVADLGRRLADAGFAYRIAIAGTIGTAWAAARDGRPDAYASGEERDILCPLPLGALRLPPPMVASLGRVGLKRVGDIIDMPRAPLAARFGVELLRQLDRALGREHEPLTPRLPVAPYVAEKRFHDPIAREEDVLGTVEMLAVQLAAALERRGDGARRIELTLFRTDGALRRIAAGTARPLRDPADMRALFSERLNALADEFDPGFGFDMARLSVLVAEPAVPEQIGIGAAEDAGEMVRLIDRLSARLGAQRVRRAVAQDSHIPEVASVSLPAQMTCTDDGWAAFNRYRAEVNLAPRPLRLLSQPEPIEVVAEVPDGPPLRFKWRRALHDVAAADGPERIEGVWWHEESVDASPAGNRARDYFRVEDTSGHRFWLFRAGLYRDLTRADVAQGAVATPAWFAHGMFG